MERNTFLGMGSGAFKDSSMGGTNQFVDTVDEAIKHWTKMWENDARYDTEVASNVQVGCLIFHAQILYIFLRQLGEESSG